ncbi:Pam68 protein [Thalictrum thalictroides]|uniref:Pam68 protein n=1 Tax=Thalictrum thalictroides TaxID=46969 RepID=A0A7J6WS17_THATH|nr:Pam68 protein [Thalictrum thalictroides]
MNTLISQSLPLHNIKRSRPWIERTPILHSVSLPKQTWKLQGGAKGFGTESLTTSKKGSQSSITSNQNEENNDDEDDKISQVVWDRMIVRILVYVGTPMATGIALLCVFNVLTEQNINFPKWLPFLTTLLAFGTSTLGIAYGTLSTSLDPDKKGSLFGWEQVQQNWPEMWKEEDESK